MISAEAANRDLEARLSRANEDRRDCESRLADVTKERDRLALERDVATLRKAKPPAQPAEAVERAESDEAPAPPGDKGGGQCRRCPVPPGGRTGLACPSQGMRRPDVGSVHRPADGHDGQWPAGRCGQRGPRRSQGDCHNGGSAPAVPPPTASRPRPWTPPLWRRWGSRASRAPLAGALLHGGGGCVAHPLPSGPPFLSNHHECYRAPPPPPRHGQFDRHVGHSPPTVRNFLRHCLYIIWGTLCPPTCLRYFLRNCLYFIWGMLCPLTCYTAG